MLAKFWANTESIPDAPEKSNLIALTDQALPGLMDRIDTLSAGWEKEELALLNKCFGEMDKVFEMHDRIKTMLPSLESYKDPLVWTERGEPRRGRRSLGREHQPADRRRGQADRHAGGQAPEPRHRHDPQFRLAQVLRALSRYRTGHRRYVAFLIVRSIVTPVQRLRSVLQSLGRGVFPRTRIHARNDEVGEMSQALEGLIDGPKRTTEFSHAPAISTRTTSR